MKEPVFVTTDNFIEGGTVPTPKLFVRQKVSILSKVNLIFSNCQKCI